MSDVPATVFFGHIELGDYRTAVPSLDFITEPPQLQPGEGATRKGAFITGPNAHWDIGTGIGFSKADAESAYEFWSRVRAFPTSVASAMAAGGAGQTHWLAFVPDPLGTFTGESNADSLAQAIDVGLDQAATTGDVSHWDIGDTVLIIDIDTPSTTSEIVTLSDVSGGGIETTCAYAHAIGSLLYRVEFYFSEAWLASPISIPATGFQSKANVREIQLRWNAVVDPTDGGLA